MMSNCPSAEELIASAESLTRQQLDPAELQKLYEEDPAQAAKYDFQLRQQQEKINQAKAKANQAAQAAKQSAVQVKGSPVGVKNQPAPKSTEDAVRMAFLQHGL